MTVSSSERSVAFASSFDTIADGAGKAVSEGIKGGARGAEAYVNTYVDGGKDIAERTIGTHVRHGREIAESILDVGRTAKLSNAQTEREIASALDDKGANAFERLWNGGVAAVKGLFRANFNTHVASANVAATAGKAAVEDAALGARNLLDVATMPTRAGFQALRGLFGLVH
jgi:hypothetical protein